MKDKHAGPQVERSPVHDADLFELAPVGYATLTPDGIVREINLAGARLLGLEGERPIGERLELFLAAESRPVLKEFLDRIQAGESPAQAEVALDCLDAPGRWLELHGAALPDANTPQCLVALVDITHAKLANHALRRSETRLRRVLEGADEGFWERDLIRHRVRYSGFSAELLGYDRSEIIDWDVSRWQSRVHPEDFPRVSKRLDAYLSGAEPLFEGEYRLRDRNGDWRWILSRARITERDVQGRPTLLSGTHRDIGRRKEAEAAMERERDLLQAFMNTAGNAHLVCLDRDFNFVRVNRTYAATCGYRPEEMIGKNHFALYPHAENEAIFCRVRDTGEPFQFRDKPFEFPDQPERGMTYWDWSLVPVKGGDGQVAGLIFSLFETTGRVRAEDAFRASERELRQARELLEAVTEGTKVLIAAVDRDFRYTFFNREHHLELKRLTGWDISIGMSLMDTLADMPEERDKALAIWGRALNGETIVQTLPFGDPGRYRRWYSTRHTPIRNALGEVIGAGEVVSDITELLEAQQALRESEERLRLAQRAANVGIWDWHPDTGRLDWTPELEQLYGYAPGSFPGSYAGFSDRVHPDDLAGVERKIDAAVAVHQPFDLDFRIRPPSGEIRWVHCMGGATYDATGSPQRIFGVNIDITERKRLAQALAEREQQLRIFVEHAPAALAMFDREMRFLAASARWIQSFGLDPQNVLGRCHYDLFPDLPQRWKDAHSRGLAGETVSADEDSYEHQDGTVVWARWEVRPWYTADREVGGIVIFTEDITERKRVEEAQQLLLQERSRKDERQRLLQDIHDGFGSQLASARLRIEHGDLVQEEIAALLRECLDDLYLIVDTMSDEDKSLGAALADYRYRCDSRLADRSAQLEWHLDVEQCPMIGQRATLHILRLLQEALSNALKHADATRIAMSAVWSPEGQLELGVSDDGIGLPDPMRAGRGMSNMRRRAREIGATLEWERLSPGTRVLVTMPRCATPRAPS
jgi:PAS domain S-box-containing protein